MFKQNQDVIPYVTNVTIILYKRRIRREGEGMGACNVYNRGRRCIAEEEKGTNRTVDGDGYTWFALENAHVFAAERYHLLGSAMVTVRLKTAKFVHNVQNRGLTDAWRGLRLPIVSSRFAAQGMKMDKTVGDVLRADADNAGIPLCTFEQVKADLAKAKKYGSDIRMASMMLRYGRLTEEARQYVGIYLV